GQDWIRRAPDRLDRGAGPDRALAADGRRLAELDLDAEVGGKRGLDHFLLHLAVQANRELLPRVVLADADQRVLLGEPDERLVKGSLVARIARGDDRLERRRGEVMLFPAPRSA